MPNALASEQLNSFSAQLGSIQLGDPNFQTKIGDVYNSLAQQGYGYAILAKDLVDCKGIAGNTALAYMTNYASSINHPLSALQTQKIELDMAKAYVENLKDIAAPTGMVDRDVSYQEALTFHSEVFSSNNLNPNAWTLYTPGTVLDPDSMENLWQKSISTDSYQRLSGELGTYSIMKLMAGDLDSIPDFLNDPQITAAREWVSRAEVAGIAGQIFTNPACPIQSFTETDSNANTINIQVGSKSGDYGGYGIASFSSFEAMVGNGGQLNASNQTIFLAANTTAIINGSGDTVNLTSNSGDSLVWNGQGMALTGLSGNNSVNLSGQGTSATVNGGSGGYVGLADSGQSVIVNGQGLTIVTNNNVWGESIGAWGDTIGLGANTNAGVYGGNDAIRLGDNNGSTLALNGQGMAVFGLSGNNSVNLSGQGTSATVNGGSGGYVGLVDSGQSVAVNGQGLTIVTNNNVWGESIGAWGDTIGLGANTNAGVYGGNDAIRLGDNNGSSLALNGQGMAVFGLSGNNSMNLSGQGTSATVNGGSGGYVGLADIGQSVTVNGQGLTIVTNNKVWGESISASGDTIGLGAGAGATVTGSGNNVFVASGAILNIDFTQNDVTRHEADGAINYFFYDRSGSQGWQNYDEYVDNQGRESSVTYNNKDGSRDVDVFDVNGNQPYAWYGMHYDSAGNQLTVTFFNDDRSRDYVTLDVGNKAGWSSYWDHYNSQNVETSRTVWDDSGSRAVETWSNGGVYGPDRPGEIDYYSASGSFDMKQTMTYAAKSGTNDYWLGRVDDYNNSGQGEWNQVTTSFNTNGSLNYQVATDTNSMYTNIPSEYTQYRNEFDYTGTGDDLSLFSYNPSDYYDTNQFDSGGYFGTPYGLDYYDYDDGGTAFAPIVLDLDGNGVDLNLQNSSTVGFDVDGSGTKRQVAWAGKNDGLLVIDLSADGSAGGDGLITQAKEVAFTDWVSGSSALAISDLVALRQVFDTNGDGLLNASDARFGEFKIWQDTNQDGIAEPGELKSLKELGITSINLAETGGTQRLEDGSVIQGVTHYTTADGAAHLAADVTFSAGADVQAGMPANTGDPSGHVTLRDNDQGGYTVTDANGTAVVPHSTGVSPINDLSPFALPSANWSAAASSVFEPPSHAMSSTADPLTTASPMSYASVFGDPATSLAWMTAAIDGTTAHAAQLDSASISLAQSGESGARAA